MGTTKASWADLLAAAEREKRIEHLTQLADIELVARFLRLGFSVPEYQQSSDKVLAASVIMRSVDRTIQHVLSLMPSAPVPQTVDAQGGVFIREILEKMRDGKIGSVRDGMAYGLLEFFDRGPCTLSWGSPETDAIAPGENRFAIAVRLRSGA